MKALTVGFDRYAILDLIDDLGDEDFLLLDDGSIIDELDIEGAKTFDIDRHSFNPIGGINPRTQEGYRRACDFLDILKDRFPEGENTLTSRYSDHLILRALLPKQRSRRAQILQNLITPPTSDKDVYRKDAYQRIERVLMAPVLERVLNRNMRHVFEGTFLVRLDPVELGRKDCRFLGNLIVSQYQGTVVIPDFGLYAMQAHADLIQQDRLVAGIRTFDEIQNPLKQELLLIPRKIGSQCTVADAEQLAKYDCKFKPGTDGYDTFIKEAVRSA